MYYVYVLKSQKDNKLYYGHCKDLDVRLKQHNSVRVRSTKSRVPFNLAYHEQVDDLTSAIKREKYFKSGYGRKYIKRKLTKALSSNG